MFGHKAFDKLIQDYDFATVLDIGAGQGEAAFLFRHYCKSVTAVDMQNMGGHITHVGDYMKTPVSPHDVAWCSHILEHQLDVNSFLRKVSSDTQEGGLIVITVPPAMHEIVGGHLTIWNAGLLVYNLVMAGINCRDVQILAYGYNISLIVRNKRFAIPPLRHDNGDLETLAPFLPSFIGQNIGGDIKEYRWGAVL